MNLILIDSDSHGKSGFREKETGVNLQGLFNFSIGFVFSQTTPDMFQFFSQPKPNQKLQSYQKQIKTTQLKLKSNWFRFLSNQIRICRSTPSQTQSKNYKANRADSKNWTPNPTKKRGEIQRRKGERERAQMFLSLPEPLPASSKLGFFWSP